MLREELSEIVSRFGEVFLCFIKHSEKDLLLTRQFVQFEHGCGQVCSIGLKLSSLMLQVLSGKGQ